MKHIIIVEAKISCETCTIKQIQVNIPSKIKKKENCKVKIVEDLHNKYNLINIIRSIL